MGPKKESAKAAKARIEAEKKAEELRLSEVAEQERLEAERVVVEKAERKLLAEEKKAREEEAARLNEEYDAHAGYRNQRSELFKHEEEAAFEQTEWFKYLRCSELPNPLIQADIDTYLGLINSSDDCELAHAVDDLQRMEEMNRELLNLECRSRQIRRHQTADRFAQYILQLREICKERIDTVTAYILQHVDEFSSTKGNDLVLQRHVHTKDFKYGLWVNLAKNLRVKIVEYPELGMNSDLPKSLALSNIAIRMLHYAQDPTVPAKPVKLLAVGGVCFVEILTLPPAAKLIKGWMLRPVTHLATQVQRQPYGDGGGAKPAEGSAPVSMQNPPMRIAFTLADDVWIRKNTTPRVAWFDEELQNWSEEDITEPKFESATRQLSFLTLHLTALAYVQDPLLDFPLAWWRFEPTADECVLLTICCQQVMIQITVRKNGECRLSAPDNSEFRQLREDWMPPLILLHRLRASGVNLLPGEDFEGMDGVMVKDKELATAVGYNLGLVVSTMQIVPSRWNQSAGTDQVVLRFSEVMDHSDEPLDPSFDEGWHPVVFLKDEPIRCYLGKSIEASETYADGIREGHITKAIVSEALRGSVSDEAIGVAESAPPLLCNTVQVLVEHMKLLSITDSTTDPTQNWFQPPEEPA
jgi:cancer susceptibility candidate protein 1